MVDGLKFGQFPRLFRDVQVRSSSVSSPGPGAYAGVMNSQAPGCQLDIELWMVETLKPYESWDVYPLVIQHDYRKSPFLLGISTTNGHFP